MRKTCHTLFKQDAFFLSSTAFYKPRIVFSACLLGEKVRYDGTAKTHPLLATHLLPFVSAHKLCPEVGAGLGVPRPTLQLVQRTANKRNNDNSFETQNLENLNLEALNLENPNINATTALQHYSRKTLAELQQKNNCDGFILKARSPSCGFNNSPVFDNNGKAVGLGNGLFANAVAQSQQGSSHTLPYCNEDFFNETEDCQRFLLACLLIKELSLLSQINNTTEREKQLQACDEHYQQLLRCSSQQLSTLLLQPDLLKADKRQALKQFFNLAENIS